MPRGKKKSLNPKIREAVYMAPKLHEWAVAAAEENETTVSQFVCMILERYRKGGNYTKKTADDQIEED